MKSVEAAKLIVSFAAGTGDKAAILEAQEVARLLCGSSAKTAAAALAAACLPATTGSLPNSTLLGHLDRWQAFHTEAAKPAIVNDFASIAAWLRLADCTRLADVVSEVLAGWEAQKSRARPAEVTRPDVVERYARLLRETAGHDDFVPHYRAFENDANVTKAEAIEVGNLILAKKVKTKSAALKGLWGRHELHAVNNLRLENRRGRSAA